MILSVDNLYNESLFRGWMFLKNVSYKKETNEIECWKFPFLFFSVFTKNLETVQEEKLKKIPVNWKGRKPYF